MKDNIIIACIGGLSGLGAMFIWSLLDGSCVI
jgi:hypothetical protein